MLFWCQLDLATFVRIGRKLRFAGAQALRHELIAVAASLRAIIALIRASRPSAHFDLGFFDLFLDLLQFVLPSVWHRAQYEPCLLFPPELAELGLCHSKRVSRLGRLAFDPGFV